MKNQSWHFCTLLDIIRFSILLFVYQTSQVPYIFLFFCFTCILKIWKLRHSTLLLMLQLLHKATLIVIGPRIINILLSMNSKSQPIKLITYNSDRSFITLDPDFFARLPNHLSYIVSMIKRDNSFLQIMALQFSTQKIMFK